jgi:hypothetical protein
VEPLAGYAKRGRRLLSAEQRRSNLYPCDRPVRQANLTSRFKDQLLAVMTGLLSAVDRRERLILHDNYPGRPTPRVSRRFATVHRQHRRERSRLLLCQGQALLRPGTGRFCLDQYGPLHRFLLQSRRYAA